MAACTMAKTRAVAAGAVAAVLIACCVFSFQSVTTSALAGCIAMPVPMAHTTNITRPVIRMISSRGACLYGGSVRAAEIVASGSECKLRLQNDLVQGGCSREVRIGNGARELRLNLGPMTMHEEVQSTCDPQVAVLLRVTVEPVEVGLRFEPAPAIAGLGVHPVAGPGISRTVIESVTPERQHRLARLAERHV